MPKILRVQSFHPVLKNLLILSAFIVTPKALAEVAQHMGSTARCEKVDSKDWPELSKKWQGRELVAFASWCSSCKQKLLATKAAPGDFVFLSVFEDPDQSARAMERLGLTSPCIYDEVLAKKLGVKTLPWSKKI